MRIRAEHFGSTCEWTEPVIVEVELMDGTTGFGEALAQPEVTGESSESIVQDVADFFAPAIADFRTETFGETLEAIESLLFFRGEGDAGRLACAARSGLELALLDAAMKFFRRSVDDIVGWMGLAGFGSPGSVRMARFSGVLACCKASTAKWKTWLYRMKGIRDLTMKVGMDDDASRLRAVCSVLGKSCTRGLCSLRVDASGGWTLKTGLAWAQRAKGIPIAAVEQPFPRGKESDLAVFRKATGLSIIHDESLILASDAASLIALGVADMFKIQIGKCGGFMPSLRIAAMAIRRKIIIVLGAMVGETSLLSAAAVRFLQVCPGIRWAEGCYGGFLLRDDVCSKSIRSRFQGKPPKLSGAGWGVRVESASLSALLVSRSRQIGL